MYTVVSKYQWNDKFYCVVRLPDNTCVTLKSDTKLTDEDWIALATSLYDNRPTEPDPLEDLVRSVPDDMLVSEVLRRHLIITES